MLFNIKISLHSQTNQLVNCPSKKIYNRHINKYIRNTETSYSKTFKTIKSSFAFTNFDIKRIAPTSNASRSSFFLKCKTPIKHFKYKKLINHVKSYRGRTSKGILCRTKGRLLLKNKNIIVNKSFRILALSFISGLLITPLRYKSLSLVMSSSGEICYVPSSYEHTVFKVCKLYSIFETKKLTKYTYLSKHMNILQLFYTLYQLPRHKTISSVELYPQKGVQYVRSSGSKSYLSKVDKKLNLALIKLPSGVFKLFSLYSSGSKGTVPFSTKQLRTQANAGFSKKKGVKSLSRGVAKNPIDHPHGGRNKAIKYQRTPWGKTTKYK